VAARIPLFLKEGFGGDFREDKIFLWLSGENVDSLLFYR
jgi:hypothetical protein